MEVKIKPLSDKFQMPKKGHDDDFCFDVYATSEEEVSPNVWKYGLGFAIEVDRTEEDKTKSDVCFSLRPRSSIWKTGMSLSHSIGTIDEGYRGEVSAVFYHVLPYMPRYKVGERIAQIHFERTEKIRFTLTDSLSDTERGTGGYGSTGK